MAYFLPLFPLRENGGVGPTLGTNLMVPQWSHLQNNSNEDVCFHFELCPSSYSLRKQLSLISRPDELQLLRDGSAAAALFLLSNNWWSGPNINLPSATIPQLINPTCDLLTEAAIF